MYTMCDIHHMWFFKKNPYYQSKKILKKNLKQISLKKGKKFKFSKWKSCYCVVYPMCMVYVCVCYVYVCVTTAFWHVF